MKAVTAEEAWGVLTEAGYRQQFEEAEGDKRGARRGGASSAAS
ncbi:MAG: hypothetical protein U0599_03835 [Vicinamibacteria bacterium]